MKLKTVSVALAGLLSVAAFASSQPWSPPTLTIGDKAPSLAKATWLKGSPVKAFEPGKVTVVEFWATWCGPCKENIPHLTELQKKYKGQVQFVGVDIWETLEGGSPDFMDKVKSFVKGQGDKMDYTVAADDADGTIADAYMKAANEGGIPCSFIVNGDGVVAWIGHPAKMEDSLKQVLAGTFDVKAAREARETEMRYTRPVDELMASKDYPKLLTAIETAIKAQPKLEYPMTYAHLVALYHVDLAKGKAYSDKVLKDSDEAPGAYHMMSSVFAAYDDLTPGAYRYGLTLAEKGMKVSPENIMLDAIKAEIEFHLNDKAAAIAAIKVAIDKADKETRTSEQFRTMLRESLKKYEGMKDKTAVARAPLVLTRF